MKSPEEFGRVTLKVNGRFNGPPEDVARIDLEWRKLQHGHQNQWPGSNGAGDQAGDGRKRAGYRCRHQRVNWRSCSPSSLRA